MLSVRGSTVRERSRADNGLREREKERTEADFGGTVQDVYGIASLSITITESQGQQEQGQLREETEIIG